MTSQREIDDLYRQRAAAEQCKTAAVAAMRAAETAGDDDAWDRAAEAHDAASDEIGELNGRIWRLEESAGWDEWRDLRGNSPIVL